MSKLQALAAARKKKADEQKSEKGVDSVREQVSKLSVAPLSGKHKENVKPSSPATAATSRTATSAGTLCRDQSPQDGRQRQVSAASQDRMDVEPPTSAPNEPDPTPAAPSAFAQTLFGSTTTPSAPIPRNHYPFPYMSFNPSVADAFSEPSPDDVVLTAQSKGSLSARK
jgi:elongation factor 1 alpha-like protein